MSITDELRKWAKGSLISLWTVEHLIAIADRIDAEHEAQLNDAFETRNSDENLESDGWVRLPKDADGVPINTGDVIVYEDNTKPMMVVALVPPSVVMVEDGPRYADMCRHYHKPTVEDVLNELVVDWDCAQDGEDKAYVLKEYAAKLRLAGDAE